jgi:hypothetical protein
LLSRSLCATERKRKNQKSEWCLGEPDETTTTVDVAGTWLRESSGNIQQLVVKDLAAELPENWMQAGADDD